MKFYERQEIKMQNINDNITMREARSIIEVVSTLARGLCFTRAEAQMLMSICNNVLDRQIAEVGNAE